MEAWPKFGFLTNAIVGGSPKHKRINLYLAAGDNKAMFQLTEKSAKDLIEMLSDSLDDVSRGVQ